MADSSISPSSEFSTPSLLLSTKASRFRRIASLLGRGFLLLITSSSALSVLFIFFFIIRDAIPFFRMEGFIELFSSTHWYPSRAPAEFGALSLLVGSGLVTLGAFVVAVPLGICASICLSDLLPFQVRQWVKPVIEILAAIPSVAFGFFALVVFAPLLQEQGGRLLAWTTWVVGIPVFSIVLMVASDIAATQVFPSYRNPARIGLLLIFGGISFWMLHALSSGFSQIAISSGTNALNVSVILGMMALPTVVSVSEDSLQAVGRELREGSYALGATRAETLLKVVLPAASSGICAAVILGIMRAIGETMVVWMASGNAAQIPEPWYNLLEPVRTLTATIAGEMGEADHVTGSSRYHVLFALALCLLTFSFICNLVSEWAARRSRGKLR